MGNEMRDRLVELLQEYTDKNNGGGSNHGRADHLIANDVVPVVRCKDCKNWNDGDCYRIELTRPDDYCSYGERKL